MSMSTFISDLPGPKEAFHEDHDQEEMEQEYADQEYAEQEYADQEHADQEQDVQENQYIVEKFDEPEYKGIIKKKNKKESMEFDLKNELNIDNLLLFFIIFSATLPQINEGIRKVLGMFMSSGYSHGFITVIKCVLLVCVFIIAKKFIN